MYLFLGNLSVVDLSYTTITVPKLLHILLSGDNTIPFTQCFSQMYLYLIAASAEVTVIFVMGYDRYVAICHPLFYHSILNKNVCTLIMITIWVSASLNSFLLTTSTMKMFFCSPDIHQFFCDAKALLNISCGGRDMLYIVMYLDCLVFGFSSVMCNLISYLMIIRVLLNIKSEHGRSKAFFTCSAHLAVMIMYYGSAFSVYIIPPSDRYSLLEQILTVFYTTVIPMFNPLIYSLRNQEIKGSLKKLLV
ncbi:olfactory receptor 2T29-like [Gastrophryne carolinensis]